MFMTLTDSKPGTPSSSTMDPGGKRCTGFQLLQSCYHFKRQMESQVEAPDSDHHLRSTDPASQLPLFTLKALVKNVGPFPSCGLPLLLISQEFSSICKPRGEDTCDQRPVTWQPSQRPSCLLHSRVLAFTSPVCTLFYPQGPWPNPGAEEKSTVLCFLSCLPLPMVEKQYSTKEKKRTSCPFVHCAGQTCCLLHSTASVTMGYF